MDFFTALFWALWALFALLLSKGKFFACFVLLVVAACSPEYYSLWVDFCYHNDCYETFGERLDEVLVTILLLLCGLLEWKTGVFRLLFLDFPAWLSRQYSKLDTSATQAATPPPPPPPATKFSFLVERILADPDLIFSRMHGYGCNNYSIGTWTFAVMAHDYLALRDTLRERETHALRQYLLHNEPIGADWFLEFSPATTQDIFTDADDTTSETEEQAKPPVIEDTPASPLESSPSPANASSTLTSGENTARSSSTATDLPESEEPLTFPSESQKPEQIPATFESKPATEVRVSGAESSDGHDRALEKYEEQAEQMPETPTMPPTTARPSKTSYSSQTHDEAAQQSEQLPEQSTVVSPSVLSAQVPERDLGAGSSHDEETQQDEQSNSSADAPRRAQLYPNELARSVDEIASEMHSTPLSEVVELVDLWQKKNDEVTTVLFNTLEAQETDDTRVIELATELQHGNTQNELAAIDSRFRIMVSWATKGGRQPWDMSKLGQAWIDSWKDAMKKMDTFYKELTKMCGNYPGCERIQEVSNAVDLILAAIPLSTTELQQQHDQREQAEQRISRLRKIAEQWVSQQQSKVPQCLPQQNMPQEKKAEKNMPEQKMPEQKLPEQKMPEQKLPEQKMPEQKMPGQKTPERKTPEQKTLEKDYKDQAFKERELAQQKTAGQQHVQQPAPQQPQAIRQAPPAISQAPKMPPYTPQQSQKRTMSTPADSKELPKDKPKQAGKRSADDEPTTTTSRRDGPKKSFDSEAVPVFNFGNEAKHKQETRGAMQKAAVDTNTAAFERLVAQAQAKEKADQKAKAKNPPAEPMGEVHNKDAECPFDDDAFKEAEQARDNIPKANKEELMEADPDVVACKKLRTLDTEDAITVLSHWMDKSVTYMQGLLCLHGDVSFILQKDRSVYQSAMVVEQRVEALVQYARSKGHGWDIISGGHWERTAEPTMKIIQGVLQSLDRSVKGEKGCEWLEFNANEIAHWRVIMRKVNKGEDK